MKYLDIQNWARKEHYEFFKDFDEPYFGIVADIECTNAYKHCKQNNISFFAYYLHKSLIAINTIEEFRYRITDDKIVIFDKIHAAATIGREDGTFAFTFIEYFEDFRQFSTNLTKQIEKVKNSTGLYMYDDKLRKDVIHYSTTPWLQFKGLTHARNFSTGESTPLIVFGKIFQDNDNYKMPVSVNAHHSLMDAIHVARYFQEFEEILKNQNN